MAVNKTKSQDKNKVSEIDDQIYRNFEIKKRLGKGAYGIVWKAVDKKSNITVAVKKIFDAFRNETDAQRTFREIMFLKAFKDHPNVIQLYSIHKATNNLDIYLAFEYMESDLHNVIKRGTILKDIHKRYVMYQLFNAIKYIHSGNVIHRDLKPSNVLIDSKCRCKIADFGLARSVSNRPTGDSKTSVDHQEPILTDYVATRWYRAPEILIASKRYTKGIDMWSLGCILGEMIRGKPLFPGSSTVNQIEKIVASLPEINEKDVEAVGSGFGSALLNQPISSENNPSLDDLLAGTTEDAKNLVKLLLMLNPAERLTAKEALSHRYIEKFKNSITESELHTDVLPPFRDDVQLTVPEYRSKLYEIMQASEVKAGGGEKTMNNGVRHPNRHPHNNVKKRENPKLDGTITVAAASTKQPSSTTVKISPSKLEEKCKRGEYAHHSRCGEKKYHQSSQNSTSSYQNAPNPNANSSSIHINNNTSYINNICSMPHSTSSGNGKPPSNTGRKAQYALYKETSVSQNKLNSCNPPPTSCNNNISNYVSSSSSNLVSNDAKLLKPLSKLKHSKLPVEKSKVLSSPSSIEHSSSVVLDGNGNSKYRNLNHFEKRHSIDCTYHCQGISPNKHQSNVSAKSTKNPSFSNLNILSASKSILNKSAYNNRLAIEREKAEMFEHSKINSLNHMNAKKTSEPCENYNTKCNERLTGSTPIDATDTSTYYEKRLKLLEEKIQKQKLDIKALFNEKEKYRTPKLCLDFNDSNNNSNGMSRKPNASSYITECSNDNKYLRSKFTIAHDKSASIKRTNNNTVNRTQIPIKYDFGHPDGIHLVTLKDKDLSYDKTANLRKSQQIIS